MLIFPTDKATRRAGVRKAIEVNQYYWFTTIELGRAYSQTGEYDKALAAFRRVTELEPENYHGLHEHWRQFYFEQGKYDECIPFFQKALQLQPDASAYSNLGVAYFYLKRYSESVPMLIRKQSKLSPTMKDHGESRRAYRWSNQRDKAVNTYARRSILAYKELASIREIRTRWEVWLLYYAKKAIRARRKISYIAPRTINPDDLNLVIRKRSSTR